MGLVVELIGFHDHLLLVTFDHARIRGRSWLILLGICFGLLLEHKLLTLLVDLIGSLIGWIHPASLELHYKLFLSLSLGMLALLLVLPDFEPLAILINVDLSIAIGLLSIALIKDLIYRVNQVYADIHKLLVVFSVISIKTVLSIEEVLVDHMVLLMLLLVDIEGRRNGNTAISTMVDRRGLNLTGQILLWDD